MFHIISALAVAAPVDGALPELRGSCRAARSWATLGAAGVSTFLTASAVALSTRDDDLHPITVVGLGVGPAITVAGGTGALIAGCPQRRGAARGAGLGYLGMGAGLWTAGFLVFPTVNLYGESAQPTSTDRALRTAAWTVGLAGVGAGVFGVAQTTRLWALPVNGGSPGLTVGGRF